MTRTDSNPEQTNFDRGYDAARTGKVSHRHGRYWIDEANSAELARPEVVLGIAAFYRDAAKGRVEYIIPGWMRDAEAMQAEYADEADTLATLRQY